MCITGSGVALPADDPVKMHQARHVATHQHLGAVPPVIGNPIAPHPRRDGGFVDGKGAAEAAAFVGPVERHQLAPRACAEKRAQRATRRGPSSDAAGLPEAAQRMTADMHADPVGEIDRRRHVGEGQQELAELDGARPAPAAPAASAAAASKWCRT